MCVLPYLLLSLSNDNDNNNANVAADDDGDDDDDGGGGGGGDCFELLLMSSQLSVKWFVFNYAVCQPVYFITLYLLFQFYGHKDL